MAVWLGTILVIGVIWLIASIKVSPQFAIGLTVIMLMLVPAWCNVEVLRLPFYVSHAATILCLCMYCVHPKATFPIRLGIVDYFGLTFMATHLISDTLIEGWSWVYLLRVYTEWACPYIAGRLAFQQWSDVEKLVPFGVATATILAVGSAFESLTAFHPFEWIHGERPFENISREPIRWGLLRAWGTRSHPIYFGNIQLILLAWPAFAAYKAIEKDWHHRWIIPYVLCCLGIVFTVSRAPIMGMLIAPAIGIMILHARLRVPIITIACTIILCMVLFWPAVLDFMNKSGRTKGGRLQNPMIRMEGASVEATGTMSRWYEFKLYLPAAIRGGLFGHGTTATREFPPRVGVRVEDVRALRHWRFVDNSYLLIALRFGLLGAGCLVAIGISSFSRILIVALKSGGDIGIFAACLAGSLGAMLLVISTVWLAPDFQFHLFWMFGIGSAPTIMEIRSSKNR